MDSGEQIKQYQKRIEQYKREADLQMQAFTCIYNKLYQDLDTLQETLQQLQSEQKHNNVHTPHKYQPHILAAGEQDQQEAIRNRKKRLAIRLGAIRTILIMVLCFALTTGKAQTPKSFLAKSIASTHLVGLSKTPSCPEAIFHHIKLTTS